MPKSTTTPPQIFGTRDVDRCGGNRPAFSNETLNYVVASVNDLDLNEGKIRPGEVSSDLARDFEEPLAKFRESLSGSNHELKLTETIGDIVSKGDSARVVLKDIANHINSPANSEWNTCLIPDRSPNPAIPASEGDYEPSPIPAVRAVTNLPTYNRSSHLI